MLIKSTISGEIVNLAHTRFIGIEAAEDTEYEVFGFFGYSPSADSMDIRLFAGSLLACMGYKGWLEKQLQNAGMLLPEYEPLSEPASAPSSEPASAPSAEETPDAETLDGGGGAFEESYRVFPLDVASGINYLLGEVRRYCWDGQIGAVRFGVRQKEKTIDEMDAYIKSLLSHEETLQLIQWEQHMKHVFFSPDRVRHHVMAILSREDTHMAHLPVACVVEICWQFSVEIPVANIASRLGHSPERLRGVAEEYDGFIQHLRKTEGEDIEKYHRRRELWREWNNDEDIPF